MSDPQDPAHEAAPSDNRPQHAGYDDGPIDFDDSPPGLAIVKDGPDDEETGKNDKDNEDKNGSSEEDDDADAPEVVPVDEKHKPTKGKSWEVPKKEHVPAAPIIGDVDKANEIQGKRTRTRTQVLSAPARSITVVKKAAGKQKAATQDHEEDAEPPAPRKRGRPAKIAVQEHVEDNGQPAPKKRGRPAKSKPANSSQLVVASTAATRSRRTPAPIPNPAPQPHIHNDDDDNSSSSSEDEDEDEDEAFEPLPPPTKPPRGPQTEPQPYTNSDKDQDAPITVPEMTAQVIKLTENSFEVADAYRRFLAQYLPSEEGEPGKVRTALEKVCEKYGKRKRGGEEEKEEGGEGGEKGERRWEG